ncbi:MAG: MAPEG family protein [Hyphomonadaceae bacterium]|nr:MAPEG family protein [Hyphomonadaceae bacterium]
MQTIVTETILTPVLALVVWSLIVWIWMYATRIPAMQKARIDPQDAKHPGTYGDKIPTQVRAVADNYNHLMEQPTIFYALVFYVYLTGAENPLNIMLAWAYVGLRVVHSLIQNTVNLVMVRFLVFCVSTLCLFAVAAPAVMALLSGAS